MVLLLAAAGCEDIGPTARYFMPPPDGVLLFSSATEDNFLCDLVVTDSGRIVLATHLPYVIDPDLHFREMELVCLDRAGVVSWRSIVHHVDVSLAAVPGGRVLLCDQDDSYSFGLSLLSMDGASQWTMFRPYDVEYCRGIPVYDGSIAVIGRSGYTTHLLYVVDRNTDTVRQWAYPSNNGKAAWEQWDRVVDVGDGSFIVCGYWDEELLEDAHATLLRIDPHRGRTTPYPVHGALAASVNWISERRGDRFGAIVGHHVPGHRDSPLPAELTIYAVDGAMLANVAPQDVFLSCCAPCADGGWIAGGSRERGGGYVGVVRKYDASLVAQWETVLGEQGMSNGRAIDIATPMLDVMYVYEAPGGSIVCGGITRSYGPGFSTGWVARLDARGRLDERFGKP
jgi:hypothetical protein